MFLSYISCERFAMKIVTDIILAFTIIAGGGAWLCDYVYTEVKTAALEQIQKPMTPLSSIATSLSGKRVDLERNSNKLLR
jgi:hypothetical protein